MEGTFAQLLSSQADRGAEVPALIVPESGDRMTYAELDDAARRVAAGLAATDVARGDRIAVWLPNVVEWLVLQFAAARLGAVVVAVNTRYRAQELADILRVSSASHLVLPTAYRGIDFAGILAQARERTGLPTLHTVVTVDTDAPSTPVEGVLRWGELANDAPTDRADGRPDDVSNIFATSGSTGAPKLAMHRQASIVTHARNDAAAFDVRAGDVSLCALPLCGVFGFNAAMSALAAGATVVLPTAFDAAAAARSIQDFRVTHWHAADNMIRAVLAAARDAGISLDSWREGAYAAFSGGGADLVREVEQATGARITGVYGASELFALLSRWPSEWDAEARSPGGGFPVSGDIAVRAVDSQTGAVLDHGTPGELQFRGYTVAAGYFDNDEATAAMLTDDGWYRSGDLGATRGDGSFLYLARMKDSLRLRGFLTDPAEIESHLQGHPAVTLAQVVGAPAADGGEVAVAFVQLRPNARATPAELVEHCRDLADYKVPAAIELVTDWPTVDGTNGVKIQKVRLRDRAEQLVGAPAGRTDA